MRAGLLVLLGLVVGIGREQEPGVEAVASKAIRPFYRLSPKIYSGAQPSGEAGFAELARLGVRTVISVDGIPPDLASARAHGIRYVHLPLGYGAIEPEDAARLVRAVETSVGPVFVHCHHGKYRGPAAAAVCERAIEGWSAGRVARWLAAAGLKAEEYPELYHSAVASPAPDRARLDAIDGAALPERAEVAELTESMVEIDGLRTALSKPSPTDSSAAKRAANARRLAEAFRESARLDASAARGERFLDLIAASESRARELESAIRAGEWTRESKLLEALETSCVECHRAYRNGLTPPTVPAR